MSAKASPLRQPQPLCCPHAARTRGEEHMSEHTIKDKVAIVGIGETTYYKRGAAPVSEFQLTLEAIMKAADDAGLDVTDIDGLASYSNDRNDPPRLQAALGLPDLTFSNMF